MTCRRLAVTLAGLLAIAAAAALGLRAAGGARRAAGPAGAAPGSAGAGGPLTVFAAASLREAFGEAGALFERLHPGVRVSFAFAGSQQLRLQIEQGAPADVFASADLLQPEALYAAGLLLRPRVFAGNALALVVPAGNPAGVHSLRDLPRARRLVIAGPEVPAGRYTAQLFAAMGAAFEEAVRARVVSRELDVRQVLAKVALGEADAGVIYRTDARASPGAVELIDLPDGLAQVAPDAIAASASARSPALAAAFVDFIASPQGQAVLAAHGFLPAAAGAGPR
ncbi:MAG: molybdate ABC transporter substrate-binding protein [Myxococcales bacterium]